MLRRQYASEICRLARENGIENPDEFVGRHHVDVSFVTSGTSSDYDNKFNSLSSMELSFSLHEPADAIHQVDRPTGLPSGANGRFESHIPFKNDEKTYHFHLCKVLGDCLRISYGSFL